MKWVRNPTRGALLCNVDAATRPGSGSRRRQRFRSLERAALRRNISAEKSSTTNAREGNPVRRSEGTRLKCEMATRYVTPIFHVRRGKPPIGVEKREKGFSRDLRRPTV